MLSRKKNSSGDVEQTDSHINIHYLGTPQRKKRYDRLHVRKRLSDQHVRRLKEKIQTLVKDRGVEVSCDLSEDLVAVMEENTPDIVSKYPSGSFQRVFWEQQQRAVSMKDARSMRWEPAMIRCY